VRKRDGCWQCNGAGLIRTTATGFVPDICPECLRRARAAWDQRETRLRYEKINQARRNQRPTQQREVTSGR